MNNNKLEINFLNTILKTPIMPASGTFGNGKEFAKVFDLNLLGAMVAKSVTKFSRFGNKSPRAISTEYGLINAIGLTNPGIQEFKKEITDFNNKFPTLPIIINLSATCIEDFVFLIKELNNIDNLLAFEINLSCPNVKEGGIDLQCNLKFLKKLFKKIRKITNHNLIAKFSPEANNFIEAIKIAEKYKINALTLINTIKATKIDVYKKKVILDNVFGGYSGPAIKPIALRYVFEAYQHVNIPIIGVGGISSAEDILEFMMAGACSVQIGSQNFIDPWAIQNLNEELKQLCNKLNINNISEIIGIANKKSNQVK